MKSDAMRRVLEEVSKELNLSEMTALEFFAREGDWQTQDYVNSVKELYAWEIDSQFEKNLRLNLPHAHITIGDSYELAKQAQFREKFDFIVLDNPQNVFSHFCEHFEALLLVKDLLKQGKDLLLIFNINISPFNYDQQVAWKIRRNEYYGVTDSSKFNLTFMDNFYTDKLNQMGFKVIKTFNEARDPDYLYYKVILLRKL